MKPQMLAWKTNLQVFSIALDIVTDLNLLLGKLYKLYWNNHIRLHLTLTSEKKPQLVQNLVSFLDIWRLCVGVDVTFKSFLLHPHWFQFVLDAK